MSSVLDNRLNEGLFHLEVLLQHEDLVHVAPPLIIISD